MLAHTYNIIIDRNVGALEHSREVVDVLNDTDIRFLSMSMETVQLTGAVPYESQMVVYTSTVNTEVSISR